MEVLDVAPAGFDETMRRLLESSDVDGIILTIPFKRAALALCDELTQLAATCGAVNAMRRSEDGRWLGANLDAPGFMSAIEARGVVARDARAFLCGLGGAGSAIGTALLLAGVSQLVATDASPSAERSFHALLPERLRERVAFGTVADQSFDLAVNASPTGMADYPGLPFDPRIVAPGGTVVDIVMKPDTTRLLEEAARAGLAVVRGIEMLRGQLKAIEDFLAPAPDSAGPVLSTDG